MNRASEINPPPIKLRGDFLLLQMVKSKDSQIVTPSGSVAAGPRRSLWVAALGTGERLAQSGIQIGDEVEVMHPPQNPEVSVREYNGHEYLLQGLDNIIGVRTD